MTLEEMVDCIRKGDNPLAILRIAVREAEEAAFDEGVEAAARVADAEAAEFTANSKACDASGNFHGGTADIHGELACKRVAANIRALRRPPAGQGKGK